MLMKQPWHGRVQNLLRFEVDVMILEETFNLANGVELPKLGLGTWRIADSDVAQVVIDAIHIVYLHIDTAHAY